MTRYLPVHNSDFNLRLHIESCGHTPSMCPFTSVTATTCRYVLCIIRKLCMNVCFLSKSSYQLDLNKIILTFLPSFIWYLDNWSRTNSPLGNRPRTIAPPPRQSPFSGGWFVRGQLSYNHLFTLFYYDFMIYLRFGFYASLLCSYRFQGVPDENGRKNKIVEKTLVRVWSCKEKYDLLQRYFTFLLI